MQIVIYSKQDCPWCTSSRNLLNMLNIPYSQVKVGNDKSSNDITVQEYLNLNIWPTFPGVVIDGTPIGGYTELAQWAVDNHI